MNYKNMTLPELLAPAGSFEHLKAAVLAGADAVYFGGARFGARAYAENFTKEKVIEGLNFAHFHDCRAYMTVNTLIKEKELQNDLYDYLLPFYEAGLDGVIVQDLGAASFIRDHFPGMEVHGSTQMMITSVGGAMKAKEMGMNRVVPARELSMEEVSRIKEETGLEVEVFIHGALCYCYSGQCLFSSMYGGRSGNRGRCAQPCRLPYKLMDGDKTISKEKYLLSPKDLYSLTNLQSMIEMGVDSLKIEGRMKNVDYVAGVTSIYRKYLDQYKETGKCNIESKDIDFLEELYSRSGFTEGYWTNHNGKNMMSIDNPKHMGLEVGKIQSIQKNRLIIRLHHKVNPKDLLVIPGFGDDEIVLTVPNNLDSVMKKKGKFHEITLNAPKAKWLKPELAIYRRHNEIIEKSIEETILKKQLKYPVNGQIMIRKDKPISLTLTSRGDEITMEGPVPSLAENRPIGKEDVLRQLQKTGNVPFKLEQCEIDLEDGLFLQASILKNLRQQAYGLLEEEHLRKLYRKESSMMEEISEEESLTSSTPNCTTKKYFAAVYDELTLNKCLDNSFFSGIILSMDFLDAQTLKSWKGKIHRYNKKAALSLPRVFRQESMNSTIHFLEETVVDEEEWDVIYINNINEMDIMAQQWPKVDRVYGASLYQWNHNSRKELQKIQNKNITGKISFDLPYELSYKEAQESLSSSDSIECMVYGRFPVMLSAQCPKKSIGRCNHTPELLGLLDRKGQKLIVSSHCHPGWTDPDLSASNKTCLSCYNMIWTHQARDLIGQDYSKLDQYTKCFRFDFFQEDPEKIDQIISSFLKWQKNNYAPDPSKNGREGHWNYGIE